MSNYLLEAIKQLNRLCEGKQTLIGYHGSPKKFNKFELDKVDSGHGDGGMYGPGIYFTEDPELAKIWNEHGYLYKCKLTFDNPYVVNNGDTEDIQELIKSDYKNNRNYNDMTDFFNQGYDSVVSNNETWEDPTGKNPPEKHNQYVAFKPEQIQILSVEKY